ncbi:hypothetical protein [Halocatena pleomorpha]|uniref:Uncharacterized protein n=1 Tax=Halocatena pleomorpha TaxID=1785090 RepID=A0A3P3RDC8_9EURY|nr:hypothetical protein [Halocatena pleomorpha]RRJ31466.1 hypothetical protein EIK79_07055 [Halocatena pleomorpha]
MSDGTGRRFVDRTTAVRSLTVYAVATGLRATLSTNPTTVRRYRCRATNGCAHTNSPFGDESRDSEPCCGGSLVVGVWIMSDRGYAPNTPATSSESTAGVTTGE